MYKTNTARQHDAESLSRAPEDRVAVLRVTRVHHDVDARVAPLQRRDRAPQHAFATTAVVAIGMEECDHAPAPPQRGERAYAQQRSREQGDAP